jgi:CheY-like chemotaxis protein
MARIVLADENALVLDLMTIFMSGDGHDLLTAESTEVLLGLLDSTEETPDLVVISADMEPGFVAETIMAIREVLNAPKVPLLVTVPPGAADVEHEVRGLISVSMVTKPFDRASFQRAVRESLAAGAELAEAAEGDAGDTASGAGQPRPAALFDGTGFKDAYDLAVSDSIQTWLAEEGRAIFEHEVRSYVQESGERILHEVAWRVVPELAESLLRKEIRRITEEMEN